MHLLRAPQDPGEVDALGHVELGSLTWTECALPHLALAWWLVLGIKCDHYVSSWRPDPISIKSMEIFLPASTNVVSVLGDVPILNSGFDSVSSMHWKGLYFSNLPFGLIHWFTLQFINILTVIQGLFANKKKKSLKTYKNARFVRVKSMSSRCWLTPTCISP